MNDSKGKSMTQIKKFLSESEAIECNKKSQKEAYY